MLKTKSYEVKAESGTISGYASTWTREPDSYGDVVAKGAFLDSIAQIQETGKTLPLLWNHDSDDLNAYIGTVTNLEEDDHGLRFDATFDDTPEAQRARELAMDGRLCKFSFAYDVVDQAEIELEDGRTANELRKLNIHEVSLVMYPANPDTSVVSVKSEIEKAVDDVLEKAGRRNRKSDVEILRQIRSLVDQLLEDETDDTEQEEDTNAKSEEPDTVNDEERERIDQLLKQANEILEKGAKS